MASVLKAMQSKSDQLNYVDVGEGSIMAFVESVVVTNSDQQPVIIHFSGCSGKPYKPNKGMIRVLAGAWGEDSESWVGKTIKITGDPTVKWGGEEVGGLVIGGLSHIDKRGYTAFIQKNKRVRVKQTIPFLNVDIPVYSDSQFESKYPAMISEIKSGRMTADQVISRCNKTAKLTESQIQKIKSN